MASFFPGAPITGSTTLSSLQTDRMKGNQSKPKIVKIKKIAQDRQLRAAQLPISWSSQKAPACQLSNDDWGEENDDWGEENGNSSSLLSIYSVKMHLLGQ